MRGWSAADARRYAHDHGRQLKEYIDSPDAPSNAKGWIVATVPPESESIRKIFSETLDQYGIGVKFTKSEDPTAVVEAVKSAMRDS